jgi:type I restriction enzyme S subunit
MRGISYNTQDLADVGEGRPFITLKCFEKGGGFRLDGLKGFRSPVDASYLVRPGDLLIANTDLTREADVVGVPAIVPRELYGSDPVISMDVTLIRIETTKANTRFIAHVLATPRSRTFMKDNSAGSTVLHLKVGQVPRLQVPFPPLPEQVRIAEVLDTVDEEIRSTERLIVKLEWTRQSLLHDLIRFGIDVAGRIRNPSTSIDSFQESVLGRIPSIWSVMSIGDACSVVQDGTHLPPPRVTDGPLLLSVRNILGRELVLTDYDTHVPWSFYNVMHRGWTIEAGARPRRVCVM